MLNFSIPVIGFVASSGSGKTTLIEKLIPFLTNKNIRVALIKHSHHDPQIDKPGKDSQRFSQAGAVQTLVAIANRWALISNHKKSSSEANLAYLLKQFDRSQIDLVIVEGFKHEHYAKIEVYRKAHQSQLLAEQDKDIVAICSDQKQFNEVNLPILDLNLVAQSANFIIQYCHLGQVTSKQGNKS